MFAFAAGAVARVCKTEGSPPAHFTYRQRKNTMAENGKKWLVGTLSATAVAVGSFTYDLVKPALQEQIKRYAPDFFQSTKEMVAGKNGAAASDASAASAAPSASVPQTETVEEETESATTETESTTNVEDTAFNAAYDECNTETGNNPAIDLNNDMEVHRANLKCLIVNKNQGAYLDKRAASDSELRETLQEIRSELTP